MRIFLAGASGVVGRRVRERLVAAGHDVVALSRVASGAGTVVGDVYDVDWLTAAVRSAAPDVVMHQLTDLRGGDRAANARIRVVGTQNLVEASRAAGVRRIVAQSIAWAYAPGVAPATEDVPLDLDATAGRLDTVRGVAALEDAVRTLPEWVVLRYGMLYGPDTWYAPGALMADLAERGQLPATADVTSFVHVDDAAAAAVAALDWPTGPANICDDEPAAGYDWVPAFCRAVGAPPPSTSDAERVGWARGADNAHARHSLKWTPRWPSWRTGFGG
jgi:nucleoside-diphosphate-sugar epimerase